MPDKQSKLLMGMAVILVALVGLITFIDAPPPAPDEGAPRFTAAFAELEPSQINELSITAPGLPGPLRIRRGAAGAWEQVEPRPARVDARAVEELVRDLAAHLDHLRLAVLAARLAHVVRENSFAARLARRNVRCGDLPVRAALVTLL